MPKNMDLDGLLIGLAILLPTLLLLSCVFQHCAKRLNFRLQLFSLIIFSVAIIGSFYYMFGKEVALYLISGFSLGVGIALRPVFSKVLSGMVFDATKIYNAKQIKIEKDNISGKVYRVGLLHTWLKDDEGNLHMIGNKYLEETPIKVICNENQSSTRRSPDDPYDSKPYSELKFV